MWKVFGAIYILAAPAIMGVLITALLTVNMLDAMAIIYAAVGGAIIALPVAYVICKQIVGSKLGA